MTAIIDYTFGFLIKKEYRYEFTRKIFRYNEADAWK